MGSLLSGWREYGLNGVKFLVFLMTWLGVKGIKEFPKMWPALQTWKPYCIESEGLWLKWCMPFKSFDFNVLSRGCRGFSAPYMIDTSEPKICVVSKEITLGARWFDIEKATKPHFGHQQQGTFFLEHWTMDPVIQHSSHWLFFKAFLSPTFSGFGFKKCPVFQYLNHHTMVNSQILQKNVQQLIS